MISSYIPGNSFLHRMSAGQKLLVLCISSIAILPVKSLLLVSLFFCSVVILYKVIGLGWQSLSSALKPLLLLVLIIMLLHIWAGSFTTGAIVITRLLALLLLANLVSLTTLMADMMAAMQPVFKPLKIIGLNPRKISIAVALMIRFAPVIFAAFEALHESWKARSSAKPRWHLLAPLTIQTLKLADSVGDALQSRGGARGLPPR